MSDFSVNKEGVFDPRDYQNEGLDKIRTFLSSAFKTGVTVPAFVEYSVGYGKTGIYAFIARYVTKNNKLRKAKGRRPFKVLVIAHQTELTRQNSDFAWKCGVPNIIVAAELNKGKNAKNMKLQDVVYANEKTLDNRISSADSKMFDTWTPDLIFIDECFIGDTLIDTEIGKVKISDPKIANLKIYCSDVKTGRVHLDKPVRVFNNGVRRISQVKLKNGSILKCTSTHKIYTKGLWVEAKNLKAGDKLILNDSQCSVTKKLIRASVAVVKKLILLIF